MLCARCRTISVEGKNVLCDTCYTELSFISLNPNDVKIYYALRELLECKRDLLRDLADSAGGTELVGDLVGVMDLDTGRNLMLEIAKRFT